MKKFTLSLLLSVLAVAGFHTFCHAEPSAKNNKTTSFSAKGKVWLQNGPELTQVNSVAGYIEQSIGQHFKTMFTFKSTFAIQVKETKSKLKLNNSPTIIYTRHEPSEIGVVRLTADENDKKRFILVETKVGSNAGEFAPDEDDIKFDNEAVNDDIFKLTLKQALKPGEYALVAPGGNSGYLVYDFAIESDMSNTSKRINSQQEAKAVEIKTGNHSESIPSKPIENVSVVASDSNKPLALTTLAVNTSKGKLRQTPASSAKIVKSLKLGDEVTVVKQKDDWYLVELTSGETGWCLKSALSQKK